MAVDHVYPCTIQRAHISPTSSTHERTSHHSDVAHAIMFGQTDHRHRQQFRFVQVSACPKEIPAVGEGRYPIEPATTPEPISPGSSSLCARRPIREEGPLVPHETCQWPECDRDDVDDTTDSVFLLGATAYGVHQHT